ncbi:hypothetical protein BDP81DRAFT_476609 [Colletotrichum phormii]|uniref:Uncharacterized protein n=1 Tax=Colletotrichum phormii TaxID=359342 RepID=A0AAI9ZD50_9PEZI|nr:uncharacterized protein BDP81DRAFT_476609 [Colletotrichum phormii]KAK1622087.1 hypothetical protein BDP81DRAFT_476609 [Colletotrichum phormii]
MIVFGRTYLPINVEACRVCPVSVKRLWDGHAARTHARWGGNPTQPCPLLVGTVKDRAYPRHPLPLECHPCFYVGVFLIFSNGLADSQARSVQEQAAGGTWHCGIIRAAVMGRTCRLLGHRKVTRKEHLSPERKSRKTGRFNGTTVRIRNITITSIVEPPYDGTPTAPYPLPIEFPWCASARNQSIPGGNLPDSRLRECQPVQQIDVANRRSRFGENLVQTWPDRRRLSERTKSLGV